MIPLAYSTVKIYAIILDPIILDKVGVLDAGYVSVR